MNKWSEEWISKICSTDFEMYPLQFANADRLEKNDAVYIFDETGCGKTVNSAIMSLHYLYNNRQENVLIISTNSVVKSRQFEDDFNKLPFKQLGLNNNWHIINNDYRNIGKMHGDWGMIVLDEAHLFLSDTNRREQLKKLSAKKVVFLTATPVKTSERDLREYCEIAKDILKSKIADDSWTNILKNISDDSGPVICSSFDIERPVTRWFKDIVTAMKNDEKTNAIRKIPVIWHYEKNDENKCRVLIEHIKEIKEGDSESVSRFIIFTRYIDKEQKVIEAALKNDAGFEKYPKASNDKYTYAIIDAESINNGDYSLKQFCDNTITYDPKLPDILVINSQIAEAGVNFPGYNYVVNYNIPSYPAAFEQRFGRIDRIGKRGTLFNQIKMVFLLNKDYYDSYTRNYNLAVSRCLNDLLNTIPSKNSILNKDAIESFMDFDIEKSIKQLRSVLDNIPCNEESFDNNSLTEDFVLDLFEDELNNDITNKEMRDKLEAKVKEIETIVSNVKNSEICERLRDVETVGDDIFAIDINKSKYIIRNYSALDFKESVLNDNKFEIYTKNFEELKNSADKDNRIREYCADKIEGYFERIFTSGCFEKLFDSCEDILNAVFICDECKNIYDIESIKNACYLGWIRNLPFFNMYRRFGEIIYDVCSVSSGKLSQSRVGLKIHIDCNPFYTAYSKVREEFMGIINICWPDLSDKSLKELFKLVDLRDRFVCSNWLKLAFCSFEDYCKQNIGNGGLFFDRLYEFGRTVQHFKNSTVSEMRSSKKFKNAVENIRDYTKLSGLCSCGDAKNDPEPFFYIIFSEEKEIGLSYNDRKQIELNVRKHFREDGGYTSLLPVVQSGSGWKNDLYGYKGVDFITYCYLKVFLYDSDCNGRDTFFGSEKWIRSFIKDRGWIPENMQEDLIKLFEEMCNS